MESVESMDFYSWSPLKAVIYKTAELDVNDLSRMVDNTTVRRIIPGGFARVRQTMTNPL